MITLLLLVRATYAWCCSSRTSHLWWNTHSTQHHRRGCNNIPSFLQRSGEVATILQRSGDRCNYIPSFLQRSFSQRSGEVATIVIRYVIFVFSFLIQQAKPENGYGTITREYFYCKVTKNTPLHRQLPKVEVPWLGRFPWNVVFHEISGHRPLLRTR